MKLLPECAYRLCAAALIFCAASQVSRAQDADYPSRTVQLVIPFPAGSIADIQARGFMQALDSRLAQRMVLVNRPGAGLTLGMAAVATSPADGYTILLSPPTPLTIQPHRVKNLPYQREQIMPVCQAFESTHWYFAVGPKSRFQDLQGLLGYVKENPERLRFGVAGIATVPHLASAEIWLKAAGQVINVPYPSEVPIMQHLLSGDLDAAVVTNAAVTSGKLTPLVAIGAQRAREHPNVPSSAELGYPVQSSGYGGLFVKAGTPAPVLQRIADACQQVAASPAFREANEKTLFYRSAYLDGRAFAGRIDADVSAMGALLSRLKLPE